MCSVICYDEDLLRYKSCSFGLVNQVPQLDYDLAGGGAGLNCSQLLPMVEGPAVWNRVGRVVNLKKLVLRGLIVPTNLNVNMVAPGTLRTVVVYDRQPNYSSGYPAGLLDSDVFKDYQYDGSEYTSSRSNLNVDNAERFIILWDSQCRSPEVRALNSAAPVKGFIGDISLDCDTGYNIVAEVDLCGLRTVYNGQTNSFNVASGNIVLIAMSDDTQWNVSGSRAAMTLVYNTRVYYTDESGEM